MMFSERSSMAVLYCGTFVLKNFISIKVICVCPHYRVKGGSYVSSRNPSALCLGQFQKSAEALRVSQNILPSSIFVVWGLPEFSALTMNFFSLVWYYFKLYCLV